MRKIEIIILAVSLFFSFAARWMVSTWFNSPLIPEGGILPGTMAEPVLSRTPFGGWGLFDVDKIKNIRGFTYAPQSVYQVELCQDTVLLRQVMEQLVLKIQTSPSPKKGLFR